MKVVDKSFSKVAYACFIVMFSIILFAIFYLCFYSDEQLLDSSDELHGIKVNNSIDYIFTAERSIDLGNSENVFIGFNEEEDAKNSCLVYKFEDGSERFSYPYEINSEIAWFKMDFNDISQVGDYYFDRVVFGENSLKEQEIERNQNYGSSFHVNLTEEYFPTDIFPAGVYSLDNNGIQENDNIEDALYGKDSKVLFSPESNEPLKDSNNVIVAIDPGHGGYDAGACAYGWTEKEINLEIAYACKSRLEEFEGVTAVLTRTSNDEYVDLQERVIRAKNAGANLFISIHNNAGGGSGSEVWVQYPGCGWHGDFYDSGADIGNRILEKLNARLGLFNRGIKSDIWEGRTYPDPGHSPGDYFAVLYWSRYYGITGILGEHAFIDGPSTDLEALHNIANLRLMGQLDAEAIAEFYNFQERGSDIKSGTFMISTKLCNTQCFDVRGGSTDEGATMFLWGYEGGRNQIWTIEQSDDLRFVYLKNVKSNKYLDLVGGSLYPGVGVCQNSKNNSNSQKFLLKSTEYGYKLASSLNTNFVLDLDHSCINNGTNFFMYPSHSYDNQRYNLYSVNPAVDPSNTSLSEGYYRLSTSNDSGKVIDIAGSNIDNGGNALLWESNNSCNNQVFYLKKEGNYHRLINLTSDLCLSVDRGLPFLGANVFQWDYNDSVNVYNKLWSIQDQGDGLTKLYNVSSGLLLEVHGGVALQGANISVYTDSGGACQKWRFSSVEDPYQAISNLASTYKNTIPDGVYTIGSAVNGNYVLDVFQSSQYNDANVSLYYSGWTSNQKFEIKNEDDNFVTIKCTCSGKYLDVYGGTKKPGSNVVQHQYHGGLNQKWIIVPQANSTYRILSAKVLNLYLGYDNPIPCNLNNVSVTNVGNTDSQLFVINVPYQRTPIMNYSPNPNVIWQMINYFYATSPRAYPEYYADKDLPTIVDFCNCCYAEATQEHVDPALLFCQAMKETGWFGFTGSVKIWQFNFGGLGATSSTEGGASFGCMQVGLRAQVQHLKCYGSTENILYPPIVDERWQAVIDIWGRGSAPNIEDLDGKWAVPGIGYGEDIVRMMNDLYRH